MKTKTIGLLAAIAVMICMMSSCAKTPAACFQVLSQSDSIRVGEVVTFDASCSIDSKQYNWTLGDNIIDYGQKVSVAFDSAKVYSIELLVINGNKTSNAQQEITVYP